MVIIDEANLTGTARPGEGVCHVEHGPALSSHVARRLACDANVVGVVIDTDGDPACVSHHQRIANRRLRDALRARDGRCQFANCDHHARLQAHHIVHWADGGRTILTNLGSRQTNLFA